MRAKRFYLLAALSFCFLAAQLLYSWSSQPYNSANSKIPWGLILSNTPFLLDGALLLLSLAAAHLLFAWIVWQTQMHLYQLTRSNKIWSLPNTLLMFTWLLLSAIWLNQQLYPNSIYSYALSPVTSAPAVKFLAIGGIIAVLLGLTWKLIETALHSKAMVTTAAIILLLAYTMFNHTASLHALNEKTVSSKPNIIIVGIDSLRPFAIEEAEKLGIELPNLARFIHSSTRFNDAVTPLARTFPAWVSILTGKDPVEHGARYNLTDPSLINMEDSIAKALQNLGYATLYATDEKRFSNIDENFGFDTVAGPRTGISDFIYGSMNDFILTNPLVNTPLGAHLFPFSYANRAAGRLYDPDSFARLLDKKIGGLSPHGNFVAVHYCLPHWPYYWKASRDRSSISGIAGPGSGYYASLVEVDRQFGRLMTTLRKRGMLQEALVFLLSDHGEGLGIPVNAIFAANDSDVNAYPAGSGHGTDTMSEAQYRVLLAIKRFGGAPTPAGVNHTPVSLVDIHPTILDYLGVESPGSRASLLGTPNRLDEQRSRFVENGLTPTSLRLFTSGMAGFGDVIQETLEFFTLKADGKLVIQEQSVKELLSIKQRAVIQRQWNLSMTIDRQGKAKLTLLNRDTNRVQQVTPTMQSTEPVRSLLAQLCQHYSRDSGFPRTLCHNQT